jgi:hypothetical protein
MPRYDSNSGCCVGVIADTHGLLRSEAVDLLKGVDHIIHAGDIGTPDILLALRELAPVTAVRGNNDQGAWAKDLLEIEVLEVQGRLLYVLHDLKELDVDPLSTGISAVIAGHSHKPKVEEKGGVMYLNPGSAGPRRFDLPTTIAKLYVSRAGLRAEIIPLPQRRSGS